jgi:hypothetical protein
MYANEACANARARENARALRELRSTRCQAQAIMTAAAHGCAGTTLARKRERNNVILEMRSPNVRINRLAQLYRASPC